MEFMSGNDPVNINPSTAKSRGVFNLDKIDGSWEVITFSIDDDTTDVTAVVVPVLATITVIFIVLFLFC